MKKKREDVEKFRIAKNVRRCGFQKGHTVHTSKKDVADNSTPSMWMPRLTQAEFTRVAKVTSGGLIEVPDAEGKSGGAKLMRPKKRVADDLTTTYLKKDDSQSEMRIMHRDKTTQMYNECIAEHASLIDSQLCAVPRLQCIQRSRLASAGNKISGVLSVDTHQKCSSYTMKYQLRRQGRDLLLQMSAFRWDCRNLPQESLKGE